MYDGNRVHELDCERGIVGRVRITAHRAQQTATKSDCVLIAKACHVCSL
jgi:hypothetical protein